MCDERRATVTTSNLEGSRPHQQVSLTLTRMQIYLGIAVQTITVLTAAVAVGLFLGRIMVHDEFDKAIDNFHKSVQPRIENLMDAKITKHYQEAEAEYLKEQSELLQRLSRLEAHAADTDSRLSRIESKIDRLLAR